MPSEAFLAAYRFHRRTLKPSDAKHLALADVAKGKTRYASHFPLSPAHFHRVASNGLLWVEDTAAAGLRFVNHADSIVETMRHKGWFTDEFQDDVYRGAVWQISARNGKPRYVAGYVDPHNEGAARVALEVETDERSAAFIADGIAERDAETERDYQEASNARFQFDEIGEEVASVRRKTMKLCAERRAARLQGASPYRTLCDTIADAISRNVQTIRDMRETRASLLDTFGRSQAWKDA